MTVKSYFKTHLMEASVFNLLDTVDNQSWDHWGGGWSKVSQGGLHIECIV